MFKKTTYIPIIVLFYLYERLYVQKSEINKLINSEDVLLIDNELLRQVHRRIPHGRIGRIPFP